MYFGPFPAFLRVALNLIYPTRRGAWSLVINEEILPKLVCAARRSNCPRQVHRGYYDGDGAFGKKFRVSATMECKHAAMLRGQNIVDQSGQCSLPFASEPPRRSPNYLLVYQRNL